MRSWDLRTSALLIVLALTGLGGATRPAQSESLDFTDIAPGAGLSLPATLNESLTWGDYDGDGDQDLYLTIDGPNRLFRNDGGNVFVDVSAAAGVDDGGFSVGTAFGDLDNDRDLDLYVVTFSAESDLLYRNDGAIGPGGETVFTDIASIAGISSLNSSRGMALLDYDADGLLDIYVNAIGPNILYHNLGNLQFDDVAPALGVDADDTGVGVVCTDVDGNGWIDIFTGNRSSELNRLYLNDQGVFTDVTAAAGIDKIGLGMGVLALDHDNDLDVDLYWTTWPQVSNAFYENLGDVDALTFADMAVANGTDDPDGWGISCNAGDVDNDGWMDFFVTNGFDASTTTNVLFQNDGGTTFSDASAGLGNTLFDGRGAAFADFDDDGDLDLCVTGGPESLTRLWRNDTVTGHHWLTLDLEGTLSNRSAIGTRVEATTDVRTIIGEVSGGAGRGSQNSLPVELGLGAANTIRQIVIRWPSGMTETLTGVEMDQQLRVVEGGTVGVGGPQAAALTRTRLGHATPNPFNPSTTIGFELAERSGVRLRIYDARGRLVRELAGGERDAGIHRLQWDGRNSAGRQLESGIYFIRLAAGTEVQSSKVVLAK